MIEKIKLSSLNSKYTPHHKGKEGHSENRQPSFGSAGIVDGIIKGVQLCEKYPMLNVTALDLSTAIVPRTIIETKESNAHAGFEAFRRESSGLIVNCLIPSFAAVGVAALAQRPIMESFSKSNLSTTFANSNTLDIIHKEYTAATGKGAEKTQNYFKNMLKKLHGVDGKETKAFTEFLSDADIDKVSKQLSDHVLEAKHNRKTVKEAFRTVADKTHITEHLKLGKENKYLSTGLESLFNDSVKVLRGIAKEGINETDQLAKYFENAKKLVKVKSLGGLAIILPLAVAMQPLNRWITSKQSGVKGAPIYKDYTDSDYKEPTAKEKEDLLKQKFISIGSMMGVGLLSMMRIPNAKMFQFSGWFPTMDQARLISTATFASRMAAAEDKNELKEATIRDIATFSSFYFLGDYAAKGIATIMEHCKKGKIKLLNELEPLKDGATSLQKIGHWIRKTSLKSSDELSSAGDKKLRTLCQIGNLTFSLLSLGIFIPLYTRTQTNKKRQAELAELENQSASASSSGSSASTKSGRSFGSSYDFSKALVKDSKAFKPFFNS